MLALAQNLPVLLVALLVGSLGWLYGGTRGELLPPIVPWLVFLTLEGLFFFPQREHGERSTEARARVWYGVWRDPVSLAGFFLLLVLVFPFCNRALCPICDYPAILGGARAEAPLPGLPFCLNAREHLNVFLWFLTAVTVLVTTRHGLVRHGRHALVELLAWNGAALAVLGFAQQIAGVTGPLGAPLGRFATYFFSSFGYANMAGAFFTLSFCLSAAAWAARIDDPAPAGTGTSVVRYRFILLVPTALNFFAALATLSRAAIILTLLAAVFFVVHVANQLLQRLPRVKAVRFAAVSLGVVAFALVLALGLAPMSFRNEIRSLGAVEVADRVTGRSEHERETATDLFWEHPLFGCGGWSYRHLSAARYNESEQFAVRAGWSGGRANVHNDYLHFLVEHGLFGFLPIALMILLPLANVFFTWNALRRRERFASSSGETRPRALYLLPRAATCLVVGILCVLIHAMGDCPLRAPSVLSLLFVALGVLPGYLPHVERHKHRRNAERRPRRRRHIEDEEG